MRRGIGPLLSHDDISWEMMGAVSCAGTQVNTAKRD